MDDPSDDPEDGDSDPHGDDATDRRTTALQHVLSTVYPDRLSGSVRGTKRTDDGLLVGVKVDPRGYVSTAKYALVTVGDDGRVVDAESVTGSELRRALAGDDDT